MLPRSLQVFVRGSLQMVCGDGQGRAKCLGVKAPNGTSRYCCAYCMVEQRNDDSRGELGDAQYDVDSNRRTYGQTMEHFAELESLTGAPTEQAERSTEVGLCAPDSTGLPLPLFHSMVINPALHVPPERLHFDALVRDSPGHDVGICRHAVDRKLVGNQR